MPESFKVIALAAAALIAAVCSGAAETDLMQVFPADSAVIIGIEPSALCVDPQGAFVFSGWEEKLGIPLEQVGLLIIGGDRKWRKWTIAVQLKESRKLDELVSRLAPLPENEQKTAAYPGYIFSGAPGDKNLSYLYRRSEKEALVIYPVRRHRSRIRANEAHLLAGVTSLLPRRKTVLIWGAGLLNAERYPLKMVRSFDVALEKNFSGKLTLHGRFVCNDPSDAGMLAFFIDSALPLVLQYKYGIPVEESRRAGKSLNFLRKDNILYFSAENPEPAVRIMMQIFKKRLPELNRVSDEKK